MRNTRRNSNNTRRTRIDEEVAIFGSPSSAAEVSLYLVPPPEEDHHYCNRDKFLWEESESDSLSASKVISELIPGSGAYLMLPSRLSLPTCRHAASICVSSTNQQVRLELQHQLPSPWKLKPPPRPDSSTNSARKFCNPLLIDSGLAFSQRRSKVEQFHHFLRDEEFVPVHIPMSKSQLVDFP